jgi:hypothetical protein
VKVGKSVLVFGEQLAAAADPEGLLRFAGQVAVRWCYRRAPIRGPVEVRYLQDFLNDDVAVIATARAEEPCQ